MSLSTKEEFVAQCMTTGKTREKCEELWMSQETPADDALNMQAKTIEDQAEKIRKLQEALGESTGIIRDLQQENTDEAIREAGELVAKMFHDSLGFLNREKLSYLRLSDLRALSRNFKTKNNQDYLDYFKIRSDAKRTGKSTRDLSVGEWNPITKTWKK